MSGGHMFQGGNIQGGSAGGFRRGAKCQGGSRLDPGHGDHTIQYVLSINLGIKKIH